MAEPAGVGCGGGRGGAAGAAGVERRAAFRRVNEFTRSAQDLSWGQ